MLKTSILLLLALLISGPHRPLTQQVIIDSPRQGEALQGQVAITGTTDIEGLQSYQVDFAYQRDQTNTWFPVARGDEVLRGETLATWDTTTISDGVYRLRVRAELEDGRTLETMVGGLRVRNYTPVETNTPEPLVAAGVGGTETQRADYVPSNQTPTPLSGNPAEVTSTNLGDSLVRGGLVALLLFIVLGAYLGLRGLIRRG